MCDKTIRVTVHCKKIIGSFNVSHMSPNAHLGWFVNKGTGFGAYLPQIWLLFAPISVPIFMKHIGLTTLFTGHCQQKHSVTTKELQRLRIFPEKLSNRGGIVIRETTHRRETSFKTNSNSVFFLRYRDEPRGISY